MQFTVAIIALAASAIAAPTELAPRWGQSTHDECSARGHVQACCNDQLLGCLIQALGSNCNNNAYCCDSGDSEGGLLNVSAANCLKLQ